MYFNPEDSGSESVSFATREVTSPQSESNSNSLDIVNVSQERVQEVRNNQFALTVFSSLTDTAPKTKQLSWSELSRKLSVHLRTANKTSAPLWSPCLYKNGGMRGNKDVAYVTLAVLDIDNGIEVDALLKRIHGIACIIHSSFRHSPENIKYRVIIPLLRPVPADAWTAAWTRIDKWLGNINDPATKDAARIYFVPSCPQESTHHFSQVIDGKLLDLDSLPETDEPSSNSKTNTLIANTDVLIKYGSGIQTQGSQDQLKEMQERCHFIQWSCEPRNQSKVPEPLWSAMLSNLGRFEGGLEAAHLGSQHHPDYDEDTTDRKLDRLITGAGATTCKRIQSLGFDQCPSGGCNIRSGRSAKAPAALGTWAINAEPVQVPASGGSIVKPKLPPDLNRFLQRYYSDGLTFIKGSFYGYREGYWPRLEEQSEIRKLIAQMYGEGAENKRINETLALCKDFQAEKEEDVEPNRKLVCLSNGTLDVEEGQLIANSPSYYLRTKTNISWDPEAKCNRWLQFLDEIFVNDEDKTEKIAFLQMWFGYCLVPDNTQHKFLWLIGAGGNGKSVLLDVLRALLGNQNVSDAHIERLGDKFVRAELEGKLVNISPEMGADATIADGYLKAIVSGDILEAERKYMPSFSFRPFVRLIASTNTLPRLQDLTNGFFRRAVIMSFNRTFTSEEADKGLLPSLLSELPGILTWSVTGLKLLRARKSFELPTSSEQIIVKYKHESDAVSLFAEECLAVETDRVKGMTPTEVHHGYKEWSKANGYQVMNIINFGKRMSLLRFGQKKSGGRTYWAVKPVRSQALDWDRALYNLHPLVDIEAEKQAAAETAKVKYKL